MTPLKPLGHNNSRIMIPRMPSWVRYVMSGVIVSVFVYAFVMLNAVEQADSDPDIVLEKIIVVPELDADLLATTRDKSRSDRLHLAAEPLRHSCCYLYCDMFRVTFTVHFRVTITEYLGKATNISENVLTFQENYKYSIKI